MVYLKTNPSTFPELTLRCWACFATIYIYLSALYEFLVWFCVFNIKNFKVLLRLLGVHPADRTFQKVYLVFVEASCRVLYQRLKRS